MLFCRGELKGFACVRIIRHKEEKNGKCYIGWKKSRNCVQQNGTIPCRHIVGTYLLYSSDWPTKRTEDEESEDEESEDERSRIRS